MKKITTICLVVGLMIACTDQGSVDEEQSTSIQEVPSVFYKGRFYQSTNQTVLAAMSSSLAVSVQFDFETYLRLFDSKEECIQFAKENFSGKYLSLLSRLDEITNPKPMKNDPELMKAVPRSHSSARTQVGYENFEFAILDNVCAGYPIQAWYLNLPYFPTGTIDNIIATVGYPGAGFSFYIPGQGSILIGFKSIYNRCASGVYVATVSGCYEPHYTMFLGCPYTIPSLGPAIQVTWIVSLT